MDLLNQIISNYPNLEDVQEGARGNKFWQSLKFIEILYFISARSSQNFLVIENFEQKQNLDITLLSDENLDVISSYDVWHEKKMCGKTYMGVVRTTYVIDENGIIIFSNDKVKAAQDAQKMLETVKQNGKNPFYFF